MRYLKKYWLLKSILFLLFIHFGNSIATAQNCTVNAGINADKCSSEQISLEGSYSAANNLVPPVWSQVGGPSVTIDDPSNLNSDVFGYAAGNTYTFRITATCVDGIQTYQDVEYTILPITDANAGDDFESCPTTDNLAANSVTGAESGQWTIIGSNNAGISIDTDTNPNSSFTIPNSSAGTTTVRWTISNTNTCTSSDDVLITNYGGITPVTAGNNQTLSNCYTTTQSVTLNGSFAGNGFGGQQGTWTMVSGPNYPTIVDENNNRTSVNSLIEGTYVFRWEVTGTCANGSDEVTITVPPATQNVSNASASDQRFCYGATTAVLEGSVPQFANEQGVWTLVSGPAVTITSPSTATTSITGLDGSSTYRFNYTITNNQTACFNDDNSVYIRFDDPPTINVGADQILDCGENTVIISTICSGGTNSRYKIISGPTTTGWINNNNTNVTINNLNGIGTYTVLFERYGSGTGCTSAFDQVNVTVSEPPTISNAGVAQILECDKTDTGLAGNTPAIGVGVWSQVEGPNTANIVDIYNPLSPINGLDEGTYKFRWVISGGNGCPVEQDEVLVVVSKTTASSAAGDAQEVCYASSVNLSGNKPQNYETGLWTVSPSVGISFANANDPSTAVSGMQASTPYTFTWTVTNGCGSVPSNVIITTNNVQGPSLADAGSDQCENSGTITVVGMDGNDPSNGIGQWMILDGPNTPTIVEPSSNTTNITGLINGDYTIQWSINVPSCVATTDTMNITIRSNPGTSSNAGSDQGVCGDEALMIANDVTVNETGHWEQVSGNSGWSISNISAHDATFSNLSPGRYEFSWIIEKGICPESTDNIVLTVSEKQDASVTTANYAVCSGTSAILAANDPDVGTAVWTLSGSATNSPSIASINSPTTTVTGLSTGEYKFTWTITSGAECAPETNDLTIQVSAPAVATPDRNLCNATETFLEGTEGTDGEWTHVSGTPIPSISNTNVHTAMVTNMGLDETYVFKYTVPVIYGCPATDDDLTISTSPYGTDPDAGADQEICTSNGTTITMDANDPGVGTGGWLQLSGPNTANFDDLASNLSDVNGLISGLYVMEWNVDYGYCGTYKDVMRLNVYNESSDPLAGTDQLNACQLNAQLEGNLPAVGIGIWTLTSAPSANAASTVIIDNPNLPTSTISNINELGDYEFTWTITNGTVCLAKPDVVKITFTDNPPNLADAGGDQNICEQTTTAMTGNAASPGTGTWTQISGPTGAIIVSPNSEDTDINGLTAGTYEFQWEIENGGCALADNLFIVNSTSVPANAGIDNDFCEFSPVSLSANDPSPNQGTWSYVSGPGTPSFLYPNNFNTNVNGTSNGAYVFEWTIDNENCPPANAQVNITVGACADLAIVKTVNDGTPEVGDDIIFTLDIINNGASDATGVTVVDILPSGYAFVNANPTTGTWTAPNWTIGNLANGATASLEITATVLSTGNYTNTATISGNENDPDDTNDEDTEITIPFSSDLAIVKTASDLIPNVGDDITFTLVVTNNGPDPATGVSVIDNLPSGYTYVSDNGTGAYDNVTGVWTIGNLANGANASLEITVTVLATGEYMNTATVSGDQVDDDDTNDEDSETPTPKFADLAIVKTVSNAEPNFGDNVVFTLVVTNNGPSDATGVVVTDNLPSAYTFVSANPSTGIWTAPNWTIGDLANGATASLEITATVLNSGTYLNTASVTGNEEDPDDTNDEDSEITTPPTNADIVLTKTVDNSTPNQTDDITYTITVLNNGPAHVTNLVITDELPEGLTFVSATPSVGTWTAPEWNIGTLNSGSDATLLIVANVNDGTGGETITNYISNTQDQTDDNTTPDDEEEEIIVIDKIIVYDGFSPNNDGINDKFIIDGLPSFPNHVVTIFNRWGNRIYEASPYLNDWDGTSNLGLTVGGEDLPVGTYFYIIDPGDGSKVLKGYIYLNR